MSISYSVVNGNRKVTLPSVDSWGSNLNIIKDPPKSITTRKIDKVSETQRVSKMIEQSIEDRYADSVQEYPRGINPSVSVSYGNYGNNGGKLMHIGKSDGRNNSESCQVSHGNVMPKYAYRIDLDGDFRTPVYTEAQLAPLSRLPRNVTNVNTNLDAASWVDRGTCDESQYNRCVRPDILNTSVAATSTYNLGTEREYNVGNVKSAIVNDMRNKEAYTQKRMHVQNNTYVNKPTRGIVDRRNTDMMTNQSTTQHGQMMNNQVPTRGISDINNTEMYTNIGTEIHNQDSALKHEVSVKPYIDEDYKNTNVHTNSVTVQHNKGGADIHNVSVNNFVDQNKTNTNYHTSAVTQLNSEHGALKHEINAQPFIVSDINNTTMHTRSTGLGNVNITDMNDGMVNDNNIRERVNYNVTTNKNRQANVTRQEMVNVKLNELNNNSVHTSNSTQYQADNQNRNVQKLENKTPITNIIPNYTGDHSKHHMFGNNKIMPNIQNNTSVHTIPSNNKEEYLQNRIRGAKLQPTLSVNNSFETKGTIPQEYHSNINYDLRAHNQSTNKSAYNQYAERFQEPAQYTARHPPLETSTGYSFGN